MTTSVLLVDDHALVRAGMSAVIEATTDLRIVGQAADGEQGAALANTLNPDVVLMDLSMPVLDGVAATRRIREQNPAAIVVVLTSYSDTQHVAQALEAGAVGYLLKDSEPDQLLAGIRAAASGHAPLDPRVAKVLLPGAQRPMPTPNLSERERQVLALVAQGLANRQVGRSLGISERTVKAHLGRIFRELGVFDRTSAALWARDHLPLG